MQIIKHSSTPIHPLFNEIEQLYSILSVEPFERLFEQSFDKSLSAIADIFNKYGKCKYNLAYTDKDYKPLNLPDYNNKNIIVCFSGGKDSIATALYYKQKGYNVYLYHLKHINAGMPDEHEYCKKIADYLDLPLYIDSITLSGHHIYTEHPMKNMIFMNGAIQYGIRNNIGVQIATGNYKTSYLDNSAFEMCGGDCIEMWEVYESIIHKIIQQFKIHLVLENINDAFERLIDYPDLLNLSYSCIGRYGLRKYRRQKLMDKFNIDLPENRCGGCYKCAVEYIYYADHGLYKYNEDYYKYCLHILYYNLRKENLPLYTIQDVWDEFLFYNIQESKLYPKILDLQLKDIK